MSSNILDFGTIFDFYFNTVDGKWGDWSMWSGCSVTCGSGQKSSTRSCDNPAPAYGGKECINGASRIESCDAGDCSSKSRFWFKN